MPYKDPEARRRYAREWVAKRRAEWFADKFCAHCGSTQNLELDHIDPKQKEDHSIWSWSLERRTAELAKCQVLCQNCHFKKTTEDLGYHTKHGTSAMYDYDGCRCGECQLFKQGANARSRKL